MAGPLPVNVVLKEFLTNRGVATKNLPTGVGRLSGGDRIRTCDLEVMSLASYRAAPPRDMLYCLLLSLEPEKKQGFSHLIIRTDLIGIPMRLSVS